MSDQTDETTVIDEISRICKILDLQLSFQADVITTMAWGCPILWSEMLPNHIDKPLEAR